MADDHVQDGERWICYRQILESGVPRATLSAWKTNGFVRSRMGTDGYYEYLQADIARLSHARDLRRRGSRTAAKLTYAIADRGLSAVKIGRTFDLVKRMATFQAASPVDLVVIAIAKCDIEQELHRKLRAHRRHGEWFAFNDIVELRIRRSMRMTAEYREIRGEPCP